MITISHKVDGQGRKYQTVTNPDYRTYGFATASYALGQTKPNYPVPAIPLEVYIAPYGVSINRKHEWLFHRRMLRHWFRE